MEATIKTHNMRTGYHTHHAGDVWAENDGPTFLGYRTLVPYRRNGGLEPGMSPFVKKDVAQSLADAVIAASTWEEAREACEAIVGAGFFA